jgi:hypothetical protein
MTSLAFSPHIGTERRGNLVFFEVIERGVQHISLCLNEEQETSHICELFAVYWVYTKVFFRILKPFSEDQPNSSQIDPLGLSGVQLL